jgi:hypothetical protein
MYELAVANIATLPAELRSRVIDRAAAESAASATAAERGSFLALRGPLFVIKRRGGGTSHDSTAAILSATPLGALHELWRRIDACSEPCFERIRAMNRSLGLVCLDRGRKREGREWRQPRSQTYGMVPSHFFGYGLAKVAAAIEMMPGIALLALPWRVFDDAHSAPRGAPWRRAPYRCQWQLPTPTAVDEALQRLRLHQLGQLAANTSGCARAEGYILGDEMRRRQHVAALRILNRHDSAKGATKPKKRRSTIEREVPLVGDEIDAAAGATGGAGGEADPKMDSKTDYVTMYRVLKSTPVSSRFEVRRSQIHGWGLFLRADFPGGFIEKNGMVIEYVGEIIRHLVADERERAYLAAGDEAAGGGCYMFRIDAEGIVDATWRGNEARFMNHCCEPNAYSRVVSTELGGAKRIIIFAAQLPSDAVEPPDAEDAEEAIEEEEEEARLREAVVIESKSAEGWTDADAGEGDPVADAPRALLPSTRCRLRGCKSEGSSSTSEPSGHALSLSPYHSRTRDQERPKSAILTFPSASSRMFSGLMSRCATPFTWQCIIPAQSCIM